jgi:hypothetical protein
MANTVFRCLIPLTLIAVAGCSRGPVPNVNVVEVTPSSRSHVSVVGSVEVSGQPDLLAER